MGIRRSCCAGLVVALACSGAALAGRSAAKLPAPATAALEALFPGATFDALGLEREAGVAYYEVAVKDRAGLREVEVTADGAIGEIESEVSWAELPAAVSAAIVVDAGTASSARIERHEVRGSPRGGTFVPLARPLVFFEVEYASGGVHKEVAMREDGTLLDGDPGDALDDDDGDDALDDDD